MMRFSTFFYSYLIALFAFMIFVIVAWMIANDYSNPERDGLATVSAGCIIGFSVTMAAVYSARRRKQ